MDVYVYICVYGCVQLNSFIDIYESEQCQSKVDPSTRKTFESPLVRKGLMGLAKVMQRLANLSIAPADAMEVCK
jgi:hypothetical protein